MFPNLQTKIENIQKIINSKDKTKSKLNIMIKIHITNINRALINIKSEVIADFVQSEQSGIVITIKKVVTSLDLQTI